MFFSASKIIGFFLTPSNALMILAAIALLLLVTGFRRLGSFCVFLVVAGLLFFGLGPGANLLILPLENRFSQPSEASAPDGIILLGGGVEDLLSDRRGGLQLNEAGDRIIETLTLAERFPDATLVFSGGGAGLFQEPRTAEAEVTLREIAGLGFDDRDVIIESKSRNTAENASLTAELLTERSGETWWLVTSAFHMPRSVGAFRAAGLDVVPYAVDYRTAGPEGRWGGFTSVSEGLRRTDVVVREWIGLLAYWLTGRTNDLFPGPDTG